jgi:hypothetical protein
MELWTATRQRVHLSDGFPLVIIGMVRSYMVVTWLHERVIIKIKCKDSDMTYEQVTATILTA